MSEMILDQVNLSFTIFFTHIQSLILLIIFSINHNRSPCLSASQVIDFKKYYYFLDPQSETYFFWEWINYIDYHDQKPYHLACSKEASSYHCYHTSLDYLNSMFVVSRFSLYNLYFDFAFNSTNFSVSIFLRIRE